MHHENISDQIFGMLVQLDIFSLKPPNNEQCLNALGNSFGEENLRLHGERSCSHMRTESERFIRDSHLLVFIHSQFQDTNAAWCAKCFTRTWMQVVW